MRDLELAKAFNHFSGTRSKKRPMSRKLRWPHTRPPSRRGGMPHRRSILRPKRPRLCRCPSLAETAQEKPAPRVVHMLVTRAGWRGRKRRRRRGRRGRAPGRPCAAARRRRPPGTTDGRPNSRCGERFCRRFQSSARAGGAVAARTASGTEEHGGRARGRRTASVTSRVGKTSSASARRLDTPGPPNAIKPPASAPSRVAAAPSKQTATSMSTLNTRSTLSAHCPARQHTVIRSGSPHEGTEVLGCALRCLTMRSLPRKRKGESRPSARRSKELV